ncbi:hypothetical protein HHL24_00325 [Paraburkholderia sp. RP-4-7]|uniref:Uncharacterized protein n=1 Tax=Paraburkholderia polaris TaxID=2728848 RepID=A0A848I200_9BURK|nr:hypothetical protein [Paraburkholderia polaris]NML96411.1 hypothetical protein [Paraburkholderia polaris]
MNPIDFESLHARLLASDDDDIKKTAHHFEPVFRSVKFRPREPVSAVDDARLAQLCAAFPTPFARKVSDWSVAMDTLNANCRAWEAATGESSLKRELLAAQVSKSFQEVFLSIWDCWRQIVHFLPFILIAMLRRIDDDTLRQHAAHQLGRALFFYKTFYEKIGDARRREADQLELVIFLLLVFRRLSRSRQLGSEFFFAPLAASHPNGFSGVFPERFDENLRLIQRIRNRVIHDGIQSRAPDLIEPVIRLTSVCFLDMLGTLLPVCEAYSIGYVLNLQVGEDRIKATVLDFSGLEGPLEIQREVVTEPQSSEYAFEELQLYLIARQSAANTAPLGHADYLDLTPFLISERPREAPGGPRQMLFALQQYLAPLSQLLFRELSGTAQRNLPLGVDNPQGRSLLDKIESFKSRTGELTAQIVIRTGSGVSVAQMRSVLWSIAKHHLSDLLPTSLYDERGALTPLQMTLPDASRMAYDPALFVEPQNGGQLLTFFGSDRRGLLVIGDSGCGKSNLLIHHYLASLRAGGLAIFLAGRQFDTALFRDTLANSVLAKVSADWRTLADLHEFLDEYDETLLIFIDAVNEYSGKQGALALLDDLIDTVQTDPALRRCKVIASCRSETWNRYAEQRRRTLDASVFLLEDGAPLHLHAFDSVALRRTLYEHYQQHYRLLPASFDALSDAVRELIAQPLLMALVAQAYANDRPGEAAPGVSIPADLDYYTLFDRLTERKKDAALVLVPVDDVLDRETAPEKLDKFCRLLAEMIYARLTAPGSRKDGAASRDAVPVDEVDKNPALQAYVRRSGVLCILDLALGVGLIERSETPQRDPNGKRIVGRAFRFFHDQYTQYWLSAAYQQSILGWLDVEALADPARLDALVATMASIAAHAIDAPVLTGALDHWLQRNLIDLHEGKLAPMMPLLERIVAHESAALQVQLVSMLSTLILRGALPAPQVYEPIFAQGTPALRLRLVSSFVDFWPALPPAAARALIEACDAERDREVLERLADVFTVHLLEDHAAVIAYLDTVIDAFTAGSVLKLASARRQFRFMLQFTVFSLMASFDHAERVAALRQLFRAKYASVADLLFGADHGASLKAKARTLFRQILYARAESFGVSQWHRFIGYMEESGNREFYVARDGVVQHDLLREFLPYAIQLHNGEFGQLTLEPGTPFHDLMLRMLDYRVMSIVGYNAVLALPSVLLRHDWPETEAFVMTLLERRTDAVRFFGNLLLLNLSYSDPARAQACLKLMHERIVPLMLRERLDCDWSIIFCIADLDVEALWPTFEPIVRQLLDHVESAGDAAACAAFGDVLYKVCYCPEIRLGRRMIEFLLTGQSRFLGPLWRVCTLKVFAAMLARSPATLRAVCAAHGVGESVIREARALQSDDIVMQSRLFPMQVDVNRFTAWVYVGEPRLRRTVIKYFVGSLATGDSIEDFSTGVRQTVVALMRVFFGGDATRTHEVPAGPLSFDDIEAATLAARGWRRRAARVAMGPASSP